MQVQANMSGLNSSLELTLRVDKCSYIIQFTEYLLYFDMLCHLAGKLRLPLFLVNLCQGRNSDRQIVNLVESKYETFSVFSFSIYIITNLISLTSLELVCYIAQFEGHHSHLQNLHNCM